MHRAVTSKEIVGGYALAGFTVCLGIYLGVKIGNPIAWSLFTRGFYIAAALIVLKSTFTWGRLRGFPAQRDDGRIAVANVVRSLVMAVIVGGLLALVIGPFAVLSLRLAH